MRDNDQTNESVPTMIYPDQLDFCVDSGIHTWRREITKRFRLSTGNYVIVPNNYYEDRNCKFLMRVYTQTEVTNR